MVAIISSKYIMLIGLS